WACGCTPNTLIVKGNEKERMSFLVSEVKAPKNYDGSLYIRQTAEEIFLLFETRWSPDEHWFQEACEKFPTLEIELIHVEENEGIAGRMWNDGGNVKSILAYRDEDRHAYNQIVYS
ncbi:hypothetical protein ABER69_21060, partial [Bacillus paranthracis]